MLSIFRAAAFCGLSSSVPLDGAADRNSGRDDDRKPDRPIHVSVYIFRRRRTAVNAGHLPGLAGLHNEFLTVETRSRMRSNSLPKRGAVSVLTCEGLRLAETYMLRWGDVLDESRFPRTRAQREKRHSSLTTVGS
jgi:hypothetical protein